MGAGAAQDQGDLRQPVEVESAKVLQDGTGPLQPDIPGMCTKLVPVPCCKSSKEDSQKTVNKTYRTVNFVSYYDTYGTNPTNNVGMCSIYMYVLLLQERTHDQGQSA